MAAQRAEQCQKHVVLSRFSNTDLSYTNSAGSKVLKTHGFRPIWRRAFEFPCQPMPSAWPSVIPSAWITASPEHRFPKISGSKCQKHVVFSNLDCEFWNFRPAGDRRLGPVSAIGLEHCQPRWESFELGISKVTKIHGFKQL